MKATETTLLSFLKRSQQFVIPIYQRTYSWTEKECTQLWGDIIRAGQNEMVRAHFVGSFVYIEKGLYQVSSQSPLMVIDGQQRLTTVSLLLEALARQLGDDEPADGLSAKKLRSYYLQNPLETGENRFKLLLSQSDKGTLLALIQQKDLPDEHSLRVEKNFEFFQEKIAALEPSDLLALWSGLSKLSVVDISLDREQDNPQLIFESMNSTGLELSQADLIRNYVLMDLEPDHQAELYNGHWRPMELNFGQKAYGAHFDSFMRHYLTLKTGEIPKIKAVYEAFKAHSREPEVERSGVDELVRDLQSFAGYYCAMALGEESDPKLDEVFQDLRELGVDVAYPLLLEMYHDYATQVLPRDDFEKAVRLVEAYVFRRAICGIPTNSMNRTFANFTTSLKKDRYLESVQAAFQLLPSYRRFPADDEFKRDFVMRDLYNFARRSYWLRRLENHDRKERVSVDEYTIEHIMPQNENLSERWREDLGPEWKRVHDTKLHTLGNLTLTGYNSEYSDRPFREKRDMQFGFGDSPLRLNEGLGQIEIWDETAIDQRANRLADRGPKVWRAPDLSDYVLDSFRPSTESRETLLSGLYTIEDHSHIAAGAPMREIFDELSRELKALDPCISEEFLKYYVAYKAETNFVDVVPQAKRLLLSLNLGFHELHDPHGIARDVTDIGTWGNGDIDVGLASSEDIPYVLGLVRQALEKQMGDLQD